MFLLGGGIEDTPTIRTVIRKIKTREPPKRMKRLGGEKRRGTTYPFLLFLVYVLQESLLLFWKGRVLLLFYGVGTDPSVVYPIVLVGLFF